MTFHGNIDESRYLGVNNSLDFKSYNFHQSIALLFTVNFGRSTRRRTRRTLTEKNRAGQLRFLGNVRK